MAETASPGIQRAMFAAVTGLPAALALCFPEPAALLFVACAMMTVSQIAALTCSTQSRAALNPNAVRVKWLLDLAVVTPFAALCLAYLNSWVPLFVGMGAVLLRGGWEAAGLARQCPPSEPRGEWLLRPLAGAGLVGAAWLVATTRIPGASFDAATALKDAWWLAMLTALALTISAVDSAARLAGTRRGAALSNPL